MGTVTLVAPDIRCATCKDNIENDLSEAAGVRNVTVAVESKEVAVDYDDAVLTPEVLRQTMADIGYPAAD
jgi:copper chaperone CopZ